jgi:hypothetical protein
VRNACELLRDLAQSEAACHVINANPAAIAALGKAANANTADSKARTLSFLRHIGSGHFSPGEAIIYIVRKN